MTQKNVSYSKLVALIRKQINEVRANPFYYIGYLNSKKARFDSSEDGKVFYPLKKLRQLSVLTKEGERGKIVEPFIAIDTAITFLTRQATSVNLMWSYQLHLIAHKKAARLASKDFYQPSELIEEVFEMANQNGQTRTERPEEDSSQVGMKQEMNCIIDREHYLIYYGVIDPKELVSQIIIDDGFPERGTYLFNN